MFDIKGTLLGVFNSIYATIVEKLTDTFGFLFNPLTRWYVYFILFCAACTFIGFFLQFKWVRAVLGAAILLAGAFVYGGTVMYREQQARLAAQKKAKKR